MKLKRAGFEYHGDVWLPRIWVVEARYKDKCRHVKYYWFAVERRAYHNKHKALKAIESYKKRNIDWFEYRIVKYERMRGENHGK